MLTAQVGSCPWWAVGILLGLSSCKKWSWLYRMIVRLQISCKSTSSFAGRPIRSRVGSENGLDPAVCRCWGKLDGSTGQASLWQQLSIKNKCANSNIKRKQKRLIWVKNLLLRWFDGVDVQLGWRPPSTAKRPTKHTRTAKWHSKDN
jgi:hypothetical protein